MNARTIRRFAVGLAWAAAISGTMLVPDEARSQTPRTIHGIVTDAATGRTLAAVHVTTTRKGALSDEEGRFRIEVESDTVTLRFHRVGYTELERRAADFGGIIALTAAPVLLDGIVAQAHRGHELAIGTALAVASTSGDEVRSRAAPSLADAMVGVEGLSVARMGAWGSRPVLRGLGGERLAILVDGSRLNRACTFGMDQGLATIDPSTVERIEILSGPGSTLFGSGSIGGVINVVTRRGDGDRPVSGEVRSGLSSGVPGGFAGASVWLRGSRWDASLAVDGSSYGDYRTPAGEVPGSGFKQGGGDLKLGFAPSPAHRLQFQTQLYEARDIGWPGMAGGVASIPEESRNAFALDYAWQRSARVVDAISARVYRQRLDHHMVMEMEMAGPMGHPMLSTTDARSFSTTVGGRVQARLRPSAFSHVDVGAEVTQWAAEATRWMEQTMMGNTTSTAFRTWPAVRILDAGTFAQGEAQLTEAVALSLGARVDRVGRRAEEQATTTEWVGTGNLGVKVDLGRGFGARSTLGTGYRIPDPTELFGLAVRPDGFLYRGNPKLGTETSRNVELSLDYGGTAYSASATLFRNQLNGLIAPVLVDGERVGGRQVRTYGNINEARLTGASGSARWAVTTAAEVGGTVTYTRGIDARTGDPLAQIPPLETTVALTVTPDVGPEWVTLEARAAARQTRVAAELGETATPGYGILNLRTGIALAGLDLVTGVENILDHEYRGHLDPRVVPQPGRNLYLRIRRAF